MRNSEQNKYDRKFQESGFSLVELLVSILVFLIFMGAIYGLLKIGSIQKTSASAQSDAIKNARLSLNTIGRDAVNAGFGYTRVGGFGPDDVLSQRLGVPADIDLKHDLLTAIVSGNEINTNSRLTTGKTDVISFVFRDTSFNIGQPVELITAADLGGAGVRITARPGHAAYVRAYDLFLVSDGVRTSLGLVTGDPVGDLISFQTGGADPLKVNLPYAGTVDTRSKLVACNPPTIDDSCIDYSSRVTAKKVIWVSYSVMADGTLVRTLYGNNTGKLFAEQIQVHPIASDIQNFQVKYLMRDGSVSDDPSNGGADQSNLNNVVQIDVTITALVESVENGVKISNLVNIKSTFSTKNLSYDIG